MPKGETFDEEELAALAKKYRQATGKNRTAAARELGVARPTLISAEDNPRASLTKLRIRIIEAYSPNKVIGPKFWLERP